MSRPGKNDNPDIYDPAFVEDLFERMSASYDRVNRLTSFGFSTRWRRQCVQALQLQPGMQVVDLMCGMGETWPYVMRKIGRGGRLSAVDFCPAMTRLAARRKLQFSVPDIDLRTENALNSSLPAGEANALVATFGLKTFSAEQLDLLAAEVWRLLQPGGKFSMVEVSAPDHPVLAAPYLFYLKKVIPLLGKILLGDPASYRMLGVYTERFKNCRQVQPCFEKAGFRVQAYNLFGGCASGLLGVKPI